MQKIIDKYPEIVSLVQFGSSISGDTYSGSDIDMLIILKTRDKELEEKIQEEFDWKYQLHIHDETEFKESIEKREPLSLSIVRTGKVILGEKFINTFRNVSPEEYTLKRCMLNSFAALGSGISDFTRGWNTDAVNSFYHAARSSIWAILFKTEITPSNKRIFTLLDDEETKRLYQEIIDFRQRISQEEHDFETEKKLWQGSLDNEFAQLIKKTNVIIKKNYFKIFQQEFFDIFQVMELLRNRYPQPKYHTVMFSMNWERCSPEYYIILSYFQQWIRLEIDAHTGEIKNEQSQQKKEDDITP